jgi:hypothetical protein
MQLFIPGPTPADVYSWGLGVAVYTWAYLWAFICLFLGLDAAVYTWAYLWMFILGSGCSWVHIPGPTCGYFFVYSWVWMQLFIPGPTYGCLFLGLWV